MPKDVFRQQALLALKHRRFSEEIVRLKTAELAETNAAIAQLQQELRHHLSDPTAEEDKSALNAEIKPFELKTDNMMLSVSEQSTNMSRAMHQAQLAQHRAHCHGAAWATADVSASVASLFS